MKIWFRYLFLRLLKTFLFFLLSIFLVYTTIDLSIHGVRFFSKTSVEWLAVLSYYFHSFASQLEFFFPFTLLLASLKVLTDLGLNHELTALQMAGLSKKKLTSPFFAFAAILCLISFAGGEWISPKAQKEIASFRSVHTKREKKKKSSHIFKTPLQDKSELIYQEFNESSHELFDVFWIKNSKDLWHIKFLWLDPEGIKSPRGRFADRFQRNRENKLEKTESHLGRTFPEIIFDSSIGLKTFVPIEDRPLSTLFQQAIKPSSETNSVRCHLHYKLASPLISLLILFAISPFAMSFSRSKSVFLLTAVSIFAFVGFITILDGMFILGENQVIAASLAIWGPIAFALLLFIPRFAKT